MDCLAPTQPQWLDELEAMGMKEIVEAKEGRLEARTLTVVSMEYTSDGIGQGSDPT